MAQKLSAESAIQFQEGISLVLSRWSALQIAVDNEFGGRNSRLKSQQLALDVFSWFTQTKGQLCSDDLEDMLFELMVSLFNTQLDDGSDGEIADKLMEMHEECVQSNYQSIQLLRETNVPRAPGAHIRQAANDEDDDDSSSDEEDNCDEMEVDTSDSQTNLNHNNSDMAAVDEEPKPTATAEADDGWTQVSHRRSRSGARKN